VLLAYCSSILLWLQLWLWQKQLWLGKEKLWIKPRMRQKGLRLRQKQLRRTFLILSCQYTVTAIHKRSEAHEMAFGLSYFIQSA
jgi:hypothetical protein